jgi:hypothetical protein
VDDDAKVYLNGNLIGQTPLNVWNCQSSGPLKCNFLLPSFPISTTNSSLFLNGINTLSVEVTNRWGVLMGLNISGFVTTQGIGSLDRQICCDSTGDIGGFKWNDLNGDGIWQTGEPKLPNWTIHLSNGMAATTDDYGYYFFTSVPSGSYTVTETTQTGWVQTYPQAPGSYNVTLTGNQTIGDLNFGNRQDSIDVGSICGYKFNDVNGNCVMDSTEQGLPGWTINMSGSGTFSTTTDANGYYCFDSLTSGTYTVSEQLQGGWTQTCPAPPGTYELNFDATQSISGIIFGNKQDTIPPNDCCDSLGIGPDNDTQSQFFGHQYFIDNQLDPPSDICSVRVTIDHQPNVWGDVSGGDVFTEQGFQSTAFGIPYELVILNPPAHDWVSFYYGMNWNNTGSYFVTLSVIHCNGDSCMYYDTLTPYPVPQISGLVEFAALPDSLKAFSIKLKGNKEQKEPVKFISVNLPRELGTIKAITAGCRYDDGVDNDCDGGVDESKMNKHSALFILKNPLLLDEGEVSEALTILYSMLPGTQMKPIIKVKLYNAKGDPLAYDTTDILSSADVDYEFRGYDGDEFELLKGAPNPAQESVTLYYIIGTESNIKLSLYNSLGKEIKSIDEGFKPQGMHTIDLNISELSNGVYFVKLMNPIRSTTIKVIVNK